MGHCSALRHAAEAVRMALRRNENAAAEEETGFLSVDAEGTLYVRWLKPVHPSWRLAPIVVLDASFHAEIAERFLPKLPRCRGSIRGRR